MGAAPTFTTGTAVVQSDLAWWIQSRPLFYGTQTTAQTSVASGTWTAVNLQTVLFDRDSGHVGTSGRYTLLTLGKYLASGMVAFAGAGGTTRQARFVRNGTVVDGSLVELPLVGSVGVVIPPVPVIATSITDYVELQCYHDAGSALSLAVSQGYLSQMLVQFAGS